MKKLLSSLIVSLILSILICSLNVYAVNPIDPTKESSLTLVYQHNGVYFEGLEIKTYRIAEVFADGTFALTDEFTDYPVSIYEVTSQTEWRQIASTLAAYIEADQIAPTYTGLTDSNGTVSFTDILPGMYLTLSVRVETESETVIFENFLTVVPYPDENGDHNYDVTAYPKCEVIPKPSDEDIEYKIIKLWKDNGYTEKRPDSVEVDIYKNGEYWTTQILSAENNWTYSWTAENDGSTYTAVERNVPSEYSVTITVNENVITITNIYDDPPEQAPQTGHTVVLWPFILGMGLSGGVFILLAMIRKRSYR